jgi:hypothetical protein
VDRIVITALVLVHLVASVWHDGAHEALAIDLPPAKDAFIYVVIVAGPLVAAALSWTRRVNLALWVLAGSMLGALVFGVYHHHILVSPDNVAHLPSGPPASHGHFIDSAAAIAVLEATAVTYALVRLVPTLRR